MRRSAAEDYIGDDEDRKPVYAFHFSPEWSESPDNLTEEAYLRLADERQYCLFL